MTDEIIPVVPVQPANQPLDMTQTVATAVTSSPAESVDIAVTDLRKASENEVKDHINTIWHTIENWPHEKLEALISDLKKHLGV